MFKAHMNSLALIVGSIMLMGALPAIADRLSDMLPKAVYTQTFHPTLLSDDSSTELASSENENQGLTKFQTTSLSADGK